MIIAQTYPYTGNGLGGLPDALEAIVTHEINGQYELFLRYPVTGLHYDELISGRIIMAKPDDLTDEQPFRIYRITKPLNGIVSVYARHLCYDLQGIVVEPFTAGSLTEAFQIIPTKCTPTSPITLQTTRSVASGITLTEPRPMWKLLGGQEGSLLDVYGGEWDFDKDEAKLVTTLGADRGVSIRYGKNMTEMEQDASIEACYSAVYPFWYDEESSTLVNLPEKTVSVTGAVVSNRVMVLDCSDDFDNQPTEQQLRDRANAYITANSIGNVKASWKISFVDTQDLPFDKVMLGDTLHVYYERLDVNATARAVKTEYDVLQGRYKAITVGRVKQNLAAIIVENQEKTESEFAKVKSDLETAVDDATDFIRNGAGYMRFIYNSSDELQEIVSLDDPDITQATKVWRWNNGGFGFSSTGYNGTYDLAITQNGAIVADFITAGTLNANVIRAGILQDAAGKNSWNMVTGAFNITNGSINITTTSEVNDQIYLQWNDGNFNNVATSLWSGGVSVTDLTNALHRWYEIDRWGFECRQNNSGGTASPTIARLADATLRLGTGATAVGYGVGVGGDLYVYDSSGTQRTHIGPTGTLWQYDGNGKLRTYLEYGDIYLYTSAEKNTLRLSSGGYASVLNTSGKTAASMGVYNDKHGYLYLYDGTSNTIRSWYDYTGLKFADANGTARSELTPNRVLIRNSSGTARAQMTEYGDLYLYDASAVVRAKLHNTDGLAFYNASGTKTNIIKPDGCDFRIYTAANASLTIPTANVRVFDYGRFAIVAINLNITSGFNAGTLYPLCNIGDYQRTLSASVLQQVPNQTGTSSALVQIDTDGTLNIYRYAGSGAFTGWFRCMITVPFSNV